MSRIQIKNGTAVTPIKLPGKVEFSVGQGQASLDGNLIFKWNMFIDNSRGYLDTGMGFHGSSNHIFSMYFIDTSLYFTGTTNPLQYSSYPLNQLYGRTLNCEVQRDPASTNIIYFKVDDSIITRGTGSWGTMNGATNSGISGQMEPYIIGPYNLRIDGSSFSVWNISVNDVSTGNRIHYWSGNPGNSLAAWADQDGSLDGTLVYSAGVRTDITGKALMGSNRMILQNEVSTNRKLHLFPGTNQVVIAGVNNKTYKSFDSGQTFMYQPDFPYITNLNISVSFNNRYYAVADPSLSNGNRLLALSNDYGATFRRDISVNWVINGANSPGYYVATSRDGKYILFSAGTFFIDSDLILSSNWGHDVSVLFTAENYFILFVDPTGQNQMVGGIGSTTKYSNNYGQSWSDFSQPMTALGGVVVSADGNYKLVHESYQSGGGGCRVYISTDWSTWTTKTLNCQRLNAPSISADGKYMLIVSSDKFVSPQPYINVSRDYGQNWDLIDTGSTQYWSGTALSDDGKYMICIGGAAGGATNACYKSIDYGYNWTLIEDLSAGAFQDVAMSKNGRYVYVAGTGKGVFVSNDYMLSWTQQFDGSNAIGVFINY